MIERRWGIFAIGIAMLGAFGCSSAEGTASVGGTRGVTQGGPQDIAHFRAIVEAGDVPHPSTIEPVGFFAEHQVDLPPPACGDSVCVHAMLGVAPGIDRVSNWTMAFVAMNTAVDPRTLVRPPTHAILVVDPAVRAVLDRSVLARMARELRDGDRASLVWASAPAEVAIEAAVPSDLADVDPAFAASTALYDGLARASELASAHEDLAARIVLVTAGRPGTGITDPNRIVGLSESLARRGIAVSVIGIDDPIYAPELPARIAEAGGGSYAFARAGELGDVLALEARTALHPLATDFALTITPAPGYRVGRIYGARRASSDDDVAHLASPVLMLGNREGAQDVDEGRRGGGGGLFVELIADPASDLGVDQPAFVAHAQWIDAATQRTVVQESVVRNGLRPGENPSGMLPHFSDPARGKAFMMLNMYLALRTTAELFHAGACAEALGMRDALQPTYEGWQQVYEDPDVDADWALLVALTDNVRAQCAEVEPRVPSVPMACFHD